VTVLETRAYLTQPVPYLPTYLEPSIVTIEAAFTNLHRTGLNNPPFTPSAATRLPPWPRHYQNGLSRRRRG
jgi:hypothetical protein